MRKTFTRRFYSSKAGKEMTTVESKGLVKKPKQSPADQRGISRRGTINFAGSARWGAIESFSGVDAVAFDHSVKRSAIDAHNLSRPSAIATGGLENMKEIASFKLLE